MAEEPRSNQAHQENQHASPLTQASWQTAVLVETSAEQKALPLSSFPDTRSNVLTLLIAIVIIAGGYLLPTLLYPRMDQYHEQTLMLRDPTSDAITTYLFDEPVSLYPWNFYHPEDCRSLVLAERSLLVDRDVPTFLLASLVDRGLVLPLDENGAPDESARKAYREALVEGFQYLYVDSANSPNCYVLVDADVDADGVADLSCAVDQDGSIISLLFLSPQWSTVALSADDYPAPETANTDAPQPDAPETPDAPDASENTSTDAATEDAEENSSDTPDTPDAPTGPAKIENPPMDEDEQLWSFAYATMHEAETYQQSELASAFTVLNDNYESRYGYSYRLYLLFQGGGSAEIGGVGGIEDPGEAGDLNGSDVDAAKTELFPLTPTVFATAENLLYIYDLSEGVRVIIYLDPVTKHCVGFNLVSD
jgi:hypothetical protein